MKLLNISDIDSDQWRQLIEKSSTATYFQTKKCYDFYSSLSFLSPFVYGVSEDGMLVGLMLGYVIADGNVIKKYFSRRAIVPGGLLLDEQITPDALKYLLEHAATDLKQKSIYIEIRNYTDYSSFRTVFEESGFGYWPHLNFHVSTPDTDAALKQLSSTKRRDVKLSKKEGAEWYETTNSDEIKDFYELLAHLYRTKIKTPLFPYEFFARLAVSENGKIFVVRHRDRIVGGSACVCLNDRTVYEWFVCGMDGQIRNVYPSTVATWAAIEYAASNGFQRFDMMGAGKPDEGYGVREFKSKFGGQLVEHGRFRYIGHPFLYAIGEKGIRFMKKRPLKTPNPLKGYP